MEEAIAYARISIEDQSTNSIPAQINSFYNYAEKNNLNLRRVFTDNGQSAFNFDRKEWKELERYLRDNKNIKYLVVYSMDRFSRANLADALRKMDDIQRRLNVKLLTITDPVHLDTDDMGVELKRIMELLFSNYELKKIRKRTSDGLNEARNEGRFMNLAPIGYKNARDTEGKPILIIDEEKAWVVRMVFRLYLRGMAPEEIRAQIKAAGVILKGNSAITRILSNPVYIGKIPIKKRKDSPAMLRPGLHTALVSEIDYWAVQDRLANRNNNRHKKEEVFLRGIIRCGQSGCGRLMTAGKSKGKKHHYWYYYCKDHKIYHSAIKTHKWFDEVLYHLSLSEELVVKAGERLDKVIKDKDKNRGGDLMRAKVALQKTQQKIDSVEEKYLLSPDLNPATYKKVITQLKADEARLQSQLLDLEAGAEKYYTLKNQLLPFLKGLKAEFHTWDLHRQQAFINLVFFRVLSYDGRLGRTPRISSVFAHNELKLKEKGLIEIDQPSGILGLTPVCSGDGN